VKADPTALPAFLAKSGGAASASSSPAGARKESNAGDDFASVMRKSESGGNSDKPVSRNEDSARANPRRAEREQAQARSQARDGAGERRPANSAGNGKSESKAAAQASGTQSEPESASAGKAGAKSANTNRDAGTDQNKDQDKGLPQDWPPAGLILPSMLLEAGMAASTAVGATGAAAGDVLLGGAASALTGGLTGDLAGVLPTGLRALGLANPDAATLATAAGATDADGLPLADANGAAGTAQNANTADAAGERAGKIALPGLLTSTPGQTAATTAALPTPADAAQLLPMGLAQFKDALEGALGGKRDELPAAAAAFAVTGGATVSDNGLARTATVNPLTALTPDVNTDQFGETIGTQLTYMANEKISHAHIKVSPTDMGTIEVSLKLDGDRVHADFSSPQADVRQALEQSLPKLREMLGQQGFQLAQADVGHRQQQQAQSSGSQGFGERGGQGGREGFAGNGQADAGVPAAVVRVARGLVDAYA
jgi:flagellar hook-length control protein FliK